MILSKVQEEHIRRTQKALATIRLGDMVKIVDCLEASSNEGKTFKVLSEPSTIGATWCVYIEHHGWFDIACLEKV